MPLADGHIGFGLAEKVGSRELEDVVAAVADVASGLVSVLADDVASLPLELRTGDVEEETTAVGNVESLWVVYLSLVLTLEGP